MNDRGDDERRARDHQSGATRTVNKQAKPNARHRDEKDGNVREQRGLHSGHSKPADRAPDRVIARRDRGRDKDENDGHGRPCDSDEPRRAI